jgi:sugar phosphate permease
LYYAEEISARIAMFFSTSAAAGVMGGLIAYGVLQIEGLNGLHGWQWLFIFEGLPTVLAGISVYWLLPNEPRNCDFLSVEGS